MALPVDKLLDKKLTLIFATREVNSSKFLQELLSSSSLDGICIVVDTNHRWNASSLTPNSRIIQPRSLHHLIDVIVELPELLSPRVKMVIVDNLPLYFRDFHQKDDYGMPNLRAYAFSLSVLLKVSQDIPVVFSSFTQGINPREPVMGEISRYYCDQVFLLTSTDNQYSLEMV